MNLQDIAPHEIFVTQRITIQPDGECRAIDNIDAELLGEFNGSEFIIARLTAKRVNFSSNSTLYAISDHSDMMQEFMTSVYTRGLRSLRSGVRKKIQSDVDPGRLLLIEKVTTDRSARGTGIGRILVAQTISRVIAPGEFAVTGLVAFALQYEHRRDTTILYPQRTLPSLDHDKVRNTWSSIGFQVVKKRSNSEGYIMARDETNIHPPPDYSKVPYVLNEGLCSD